jgi:filamentous hemagglutinin family protein
MCDFETGLKPKKVSEVMSGRSAKRLRRFLNDGLKAFSTAVIVFGSVLPSFAQSIIVDPSAPGTTFLQSSNGTPQINIATPDNGISLNQFNTFTVGADGLILNNGVGNSVTVIGQNVTANPNLMVSGPASTIIAEVTGDHGSTVSGTTEVAGQRAAVIVANPNGIHCNGCAFLNTTSTTLTTGRPEIDAGSIDLSVTQGTITIGSEGFSPGVQGALIGRTVVLNGPIASSVSGPDAQLLVSGGAQRVQNLDATSVADTTIVAAPSTIARTSPFAVDASENATLTAGRVVVKNAETGQGVNTYGAITADTFTGLSAGDFFYRDLIVSDGASITGVEVRQYGDVASGGDFSVSGDRFVLYDGRVIESAGDIAITGSEYVVIAGEVTGQNVSVEVTNGSLINTGFLMAAGELSIVAGENFDQQRQIAREYDTAIDPVLQNYLQSYYADLIAGGPAADIAAEMIARAGRHDLIAEYIERGATASGTNVEITSANDVKNEGGAIVATDDVVILASANIVNSYLSLTRQDDLDCSGSRCVKMTNYHSAEILAGGDLTLRAGINLANVSSDIAAAGDVTLIAGQDVLNVFDSREVGDALSARVTRGISLIASSEETTAAPRYQFDREQMGAFHNEFDRIVSPSRVVSLYGDVALDAARDVVVIASEITSGADLSITAAGDALISGHTAYNCRSHSSCGSRHGTAETGYTTRFAQLTGRDVSVQATGGLNVVGTRLLAKGDAELVSQTGEVFVSGETLDQKTERPELDFAAYRDVSVGDVINSSDEDYVAFLSQNDLLPAVEALRLADGGADIQNAARSVGAQSFVSVIDTSNAVATRAQVLDDIEANLSAKYSAIDEQDDLILDAHVGFRAEIATLWDELSIAETHSVYDDPAYLEIEVQSLATLNAELESIDTEYQAELQANEALYKSRTNRALKWVRNRAPSWFRSAERQRDRANDRADSNRLVAIEAAHARREFALFQARTSTFDQNFSEQIEGFEADRDAVLTAANALKANLIVQIESETADAMRAAEALLEQEVLEAEIRRDLVAQGSVVEGYQSLAMALSGDRPSVEAAFIDATSWQYKTLETRDEAFPWSVVSAQDDLRVIAQTGVAVSDAGLIAHGAISLSSLENQSFSSARILGGRVQVVGAGDLVSEGSQFTADTSLTVMAAGDLVFAPRVRNYYISSGYENVIGNYASRDLTKIRKYHITSLEHSMLSAGTDITLDTMGSLVAAGALLSAGGDVALSASQDVRILAPFAAQDYSTGDSVRGRDITSFFAQIGTIDAGGDVSVHAGNNAVFEGTSITSGGDIVLAAMHSLTFSAARDLYEYRYRTKKRRSFGRMKRIYQTHDRVTHRGVILDAARNLMLESTHGDLTLAGADLDAVNGSLNISALQGNILVGAFTDINRKTSKSKISGLGGLFSDSSQRSSTDRTSTGTDALAGVNLNIASGSDTILRGAQIAAGADINLNVGGDLIIEAAISDKRTEIYNEHLGVLATTETDTFAQACWPKQRRAYCGASALQHA